MSVDFNSRAVVGVQGLTPYVPGKPVDELERDLGITSIIKLASNENPLGASPLAQQAALAALNDAGRYPDGNGFALRQKLAVHHAIAADQIVLGNGSNDVLDMVARCFLGPGRNAVFSEYAFAVYPIVTRAVGAGLRIADALPREDSEQPLGHDLESILALIDQNTGVVFVANPNNPTGTWLGAEAIRQFLEAVPPQVVVVLDEAYFEYMSPELRPNSRALLDEFSNLVVTRTFSKVHGLAALRIGYGLTCAQIAGLMNRVRQPFNNNSAALAAAMGSLEDTDHVSRSVELNTSGLLELVDGIQNLGLSVLPSQANFLSIDFGREAQGIFQSLLEAGVIVRPLASYAMPNYLRVTVGTPDENRRFLNSLATVLTQEPA